MPQSPDHMDAAVLHTHGEPVRMSRVPRPALGPGEVLVRVEASGVNPLDTKIVAGAAPHARVRRLPAILGVDLAGVVEAVGEDVTGFGAGDAVYGMTGGVGDVPGSLAEYAAVDARLLAVRPHRWTARQAATVPLSVITAWEGLVDRAQVGAGQKVLVHGGAGGVGHIAVQVAVARGARVYATGSAGAQATIAGLGAVAIDYRAMAPAEYVDVYTAGDGFDVIFDTIGGATLDASFASVRPYVGHVVSILGWGAHSLAPLSFRGATYSGVFTLLPLLTGQGRERHGDILRAAAELADGGRLTPRVDPRQFALDTAHLAHEAVASGTADSKIVVDVPR
ncbi:zinc-dependent alcohol dehydrogenase family protein [Streptosporangiaceae bacterium NEAU-GS5]|nr:zinc-dependent alcohol dehydrogenase family protein [Streptosporangiaceae bacterium NEAU-GS5]